MKHNNWKYWGSVGGSGCVKREVVFFFCISTGVSLAATTRTPNKCKDAAFYVHTGSIFANMYVHELLGQTCLSVNGIIGSRPPPPKKMASARRSILDN